MAGPFPGMDPWLEQPHVWSGIHTRLITYIADELQPQLGERYVASIEQRVYVASIDRSFVADVGGRRSAVNPTGKTVAELESDGGVVVELDDEELHEGYIEILDLKTNQSVVTVIEVLSPANKRKGAGRRTYLAKQREVMRTEANLVEIDLLRRGPHLLAIPKSDIRHLGVYDYLVSIRRARVRGHSFVVFPRTVRQRLPRIAIPLRPGESAVTLDMQKLIDRIYDIGCYASSIDYSRPSVPRLRPDDEGWARERIEAWQAARALP